MDRALLREIASGMGLAGIVMLIQSHKESGGRSMD